jgi:hypothetical protein
MVEYTSGVRELSGGASSPKRFGIRKTLPSRGDEGFWS